MYPLILIFCLVFPDNSINSPMVTDGRLASNAPKTLSVGPVDVAPTGWRRTVNGWERAEDWAITDPDTRAATLAKVIEHQQQMEISWVGGRGLSVIMRFVRQINPFTILCLQVSLLATYVFLVFHRESKSAKLKCQNPSNLMSTPSVN
jgi:hypothetical protein